MRTINYIFPLFLSLLSITQANDVLEICTDNSDWAPYTYYERDSAGNKTDKFIGASVDVLSSISQKNGIKFNISGYPWKRCLKSVEVFGKVKRFEAFMDGTYSKYREEKFLRTEPFYRTTLGVFYSKKRFPKGLSIEKRKELTPYKLCGINGQNYEKYINLGMQIDSGSKNLSSVLTKLSGGRCDLFPTSLETVFGAQLLGDLSIPENLDYTPIKEVKDNIFYFWISKQSPRAEELIFNMNKAIQELKKDGTWEAIYKKYTPTGSGF